MSKERSYGSHRLLGWAGQKTAAHSMQASITLGDPMDGIDC